MVAAIRAGKIECRVYRKDKFHAKAYITHGRAAVVGSFGLVIDKHGGWQGAFLNAPK